MKGALNAGCNVLGIELDQRQYNAVKNMMPLFVPKSDLSMVTTPAQMVFGNECMASLGPYRENKAGGQFEYIKCEQFWPGAASWRCSECECSFCAGCVAGWEYCKNCNPDHSDHAQDEQRHHIPDGVVFSLVTLDAKHAAARVEGAL